jgi:hypothetical protein
MAYFLAGCALLVLLLIGARLLLRADPRKFAASLRRMADPRKFAASLRRMAGVAALAAAGFLALRGALPLAIPLAAFGLALVGKGGSLGFGDVFGSARKSPGQKSRVRTEWLEMELDHDSGRMDGLCRKGRFAGQSLSALSDREVMGFLDELRTEAAKEAALVEAYLDWRLPGWGGREADRETKTKKGRGQATAGRMSMEEARAVLELGTDASEEEIRQAHRRLMMKMHPDQGGSNYLAARINEAKEVLLGR